MRILLKLAAVLALGAGTAWTEDPPASPPPRPNIVFILSDDQGWGDVGYNGNPFLKTPELDALAAAGLRLDRFYTASPSSAPARFAALTGLNPARWTKAEDDVTLPESYLTVAEMLQAAGYRTGLFGRWHLGELDPNFEAARREDEDYAKMHYSPPDLHGFDTYFATTVSVPTYDPMRVPEGLRNDDRPVGAPFGAFYWQQGDRKVTANVEGATPRIITDRVIPFVRSAVAADTPFFAAVWFHTPHWPLVAGPEFRKRYAAFPEKSQHFYGAISAMDEQIGRIAATLKELKIDRNTVLVFCSDTGPRGKYDKPGQGTTGGLRGRKNTLFDGGIRVPGIAVWPGVIESDRVTESPVGLIDLVPTFLACAGVAVPTATPLDGESFLPLLRGETWLRSAPLYYLFKDQRALVTPTHKLISVNAGRSWALYEYGEDSREVRDLAPKQGFRLEQLQGLFDDWHASVMPPEEKSDTTPAP